MNLKRLAACTLGAALGAGSLVAIEAATTTAQAAACHDARVFYTTPEEGSRVWLPTSGFTKDGGQIWAQGPSTTRAPAGTATTAKAVGRAHDARGRAVAGVKIADVAKQYDRTWHHHTTDATSKHYDRGYVLHIPRRAVGRARVYKAAWKLTAERHVVRAGGASCRGTEVTPITTILPVASNRARTYTWAVEIYATRGRVHPRS